MWTDNASKIDMLFYKLYVSGTGIELMPKLNPGKSVVRFKALCGKRDNKGVF